MTETPPGGEGGGYLTIIDILGILVTTSRGREEESRQAHNLKVVGSSPTPATKK